MKAVEYTLFILLSLLLIPMPAAAQYYNVYEIGKGEILSKKYRYVGYLYDDLLAAMPVTEGIEDYDWSNITGVIDFDENVIVPFEYRNIRPLRNHTIDDADVKHRLVTVSTGTSPTLYQLTKDSFCQMADLKAVKYKYMPENDSIVFSAGMTVNRIFNLHTKATTEVEQSLQYGLNSRLLTFRSDHKDGIINLQGQVIVPPEYYRILHVDNSFIGIERGERGDSLGILDSDANVVIPPVFCQIDKGSNRFFARTFNHGTPLHFSDEIIEEVSEWTLKWNHMKEKMFSLSKEQIRQIGLVGAFDFQGNVVIPFEYDYLHRGIGNEIIACRNHQVGVISDNGKEVIEMKYDNITLAFNNLYVVESDGRFGLLGSGGRHILGCNYDEIFAVGADRVLVLKQGKWSLFDCTTSKMTTTGFTETDRFDLLQMMPYRSDYYETPKSEDNTYFVLERNGRYGVIDAALRVVIPPMHGGKPFYNFDKYFTFAPYGEAVSYTRKGVAMKEIKTVGLTNESERFPNTIICIKEGKYGVIDVDGNELIPFVYSYIENIDGKRFVVTSF